MAYERNWAFSFNNTYTPTSNADQTKYQLWALKAMLLGQMGGFTLGVWTIDSSCNSLVAGTPGDGVDRWHSGVYTAGDIVQAAAASPHSWFVLRSPTMNGTNFYLLITADSATATSATIFMAKTQFTGGTTTANPTSPDSWGVGSATAVIWNAGSSSGILNRFNMILSDMGDFVYFPIQTGQVSPNISTLCIAAIAPIGYNPLDLYPIWAYKHYALAPPGGFLLTQLSSNSTQPARGPNGTGNNLLILPNQTLMPVSNPDVLTGSILDLPCFVVFNSSTVWHMRGRLPDIKGITTANTPFSSGNFMRDGSRNITHVSVGQLWLPCNNTPPFFT